MAEYGHFHKQDFNSYLSTKEFQELLKNKYVLQQYIKTPTEYNTSLRVLTSLSGEVLASSLKYFSPNSKINSRKLKGISLYLLDESSPFYLGSESVISNTVSGGSSILLGRDNYNEFEKNILMAHNINPEGAKLPDNVKKAASAVARKCSQEIGAICGMDFIYSEDENKWYYLEEHEFPMLISYAEQNQLPYNFSREDPKQYCLNYQLADIDARLNSLSEYMKIKIKK